MLWLEFSSTLVLTLLHSLWQAGLVLLGYKCATSAASVKEPMQRRNILYFLLIFQLLLSLATFWVVSGNTAQSTDWPAAFIFQTSDYWLGVLIQSLSTLYGLTLLAKLVRILSGNRILRYDFLIQSQPAPESFQTFTSSQAAEMGIFRKVTVRISSKIATPLTFGYLKPVVLLPLSLISKLDSREIEALLLHELAHIRANDYLYNWILLAAETIFFFNPAVRRMAEELKLEREKSCDQRVLGLDYAPLLYADALYKSAMLRQAFLQTGIHAVSGEGELVKRIRFIIEGQTPDSRSGRAPFIQAGVLILLLSIISLSTMIPASLLKKDSKASVNQGTSKPIADLRVMQAAGSVPVEASPMAGIRVALLSEKPAIAKLSAGKTDKQKQVSAGVGKPLAATVSESVIPASFDNSFNIIPAALEQPSQEGQDIFCVQDEDPANGTIVTRAFRMEKKNGQLSPVLLWITTETRPRADSLGMLKDSLVVPEPLQ